MKFNSTTFQDGFTVVVGQRVSFHTRYGSIGTGTVMDILAPRTRILVQPDENTVYGELDSWPLRGGGRFNRISEHGLSGGEIRR